MKKQQLKSLQGKWYKILKKKGFNDVEVGKPINSLRTDSRRFQDREAVLEFFLKLDEFLLHSKDIKPLHRQILELYTQGIYIVLIAERVGRSKQRVRQILTEYKEKVSAFTLL